MAQQDPAAAAANDLDFEVYAWLRDYEEHFNRTQIEVKKLASVWMLAGLAAIAFIVRGDLKSGSSMFDTAVLLGIIGAGANIGLLSLWILDQLANQKLLGAAFRVGLLMERCNPALPPIRSIMWVKSKHRGMGRYHDLFYASPMFFNALAAGYGLSIGSRDQGPLFAAAAVAAGAFLIPFGQWLQAFRYRRPEDREETDAHADSDESKTIKRWEERLERRSSDYS